MLIEHVRSIDLYEGYTPIEGEKHISATSILKPAMQLWLKLRTPEDELIETDKDAAIFGSLIHYAMEKLVSEKLFEKGLAQGYEERLSTRFNGYTINGQFDIIVNGHVCDYKTGKVASLKDMTNYIWQLSIYRWLYWKGTGKVLEDTGFLLYFLKDFTILKVDSTDYRKYNVVSMIHEVEVKLKTFDEVEVFVASKIDDAEDFEIPEECDTWYKDMRCNYFCEFRDVCKYNIKRQEELTSW
jgi:hypothetical protein